jgi:hypothetical protein
VERKIHAKRKRKSTRKRRPRETPEEERSLRIAVDQTRSNSCFEKHSVFSNDLARQFGQRRQRDVETVAQTWCLLRPGGIFSLGLPARDPTSSKDELFWSAHRHYGPLRLVEMFAGFEHMETIDTREFGAAVHSASIIHILRKPSAVPGDLTSDPSSDKNATEHVKSRSWTYKRNPKTL